MRANKYVFKTLGLSLSILASVFFSTGFIKTGPTLRDGVWRAVLQRTDGQQVVFNFKVEDSLGQKVIYVFNSNDRLRVDSITFKGDSVFIQMPFFGSYFDAKINKDGSLRGTWTKDYGDRLAVMPFHAMPGDETRLFSYARPTGNVTGSWAASFPGQRQDTFKAIGLFNQKGNQITGTFMTPSGDYRYLQGVVSGDTVKLSGFDGCHALLFTALINGKNTLSDGKLYSINSREMNWSAVRKTFKTLPSAYSVDNIQPGKVRLSFHLKDMLTSEEVSITDKKYLGKVVVVQILGSWCPNCMDETRFFTQNYKRYHQRGVDFIGIDFERTADFNKSKSAMQSFFKNFNIHYPILFSGVAADDPDLTKKVFPNLPIKIQAFPTTIFIDKQGYVRKIHNGINGPATGKYYDQYKEDFKNIVNGLLAE